MISEDFSQQEINIIKAALHLYMRYTVITSVDYQLAKDLYNTFTNFQPQHSRETETNESHSSSAGKET